MHWPYPVGFAHRLGGALAPENTLAGLLPAHRLGVTAVECDVHLSADGVAATRVSPASRSAAIAICMVFLSANVE